MAHPTRHPSSAAWDAWINDPPPYPALPLLAPEAQRSHWAPRLAMVQCDQCGGQVMRYHSCGNRHCPKCQTLAKLRWVEARCSELLDIPYFHCVLTLPHELNPLAQGNPQILYGLLFRSAAATLQTFGRDPRWLGGELGLTLVLHTWGQTLEHHIHVHGIVTGGALAPDSERWIATKRRDFGSVPQLP